MRRVLTAGLVAAILAGGCGGGDDDDGDASLPPAQEPEFGSIPFSELEKCDPLPNNPKYRCGTIEVPFERADPSYGTTEVGFAVLPRRDRSRPPEGAIFMVEGGPGYSSTGTGGTYYHLARPLLENHDLVLVDQRGQGLSEQFDCPDLQTGEGPEFVTVAQCARRLGDRFVSYRTSAAADDINSVREALGYEKIALYGDSYGTFLAQSYAFRHGETLDALVLDSAYPAYGESPWYPSLPRTGIRSLGLACDRDPECNGDAIERLEVGLDTLREQRRPVIDAVTALIDASGGPPESYLQFDRALSELVDGDPTAWEKLTSPARVGIRNDDRYQSPGQWVVSCNDYPMIWDKQASEYDRRVQLDEAISDYPKNAFAPFKVREIAYSPGTAYLACLTWPPLTEVYEPPVDPETDEPTAAPVLVVSGEMDDITTPTEGRTVAGFFPDSRQYIDRNGGHVDALYSPNGKAGNEIREFLAEALGVNLD
jgi:pimeloyl-ACP methyl ester carboxylesterase